MPFPSHLLKNMLGLHPKPKLPPNRNVLRGQIGPPIFKKLVLNHRTLVELPKLVNKEVL